MNQILGIQGVSGSGPPFQSAASAVVLHPADAPVQPLKGVGPAIPQEVGLSYEVNRQTGDVIVKVVDPITKEIIREIPSEQIQKLRATMEAILGQQLDRTG